MPKTRHEYDQEKLRRRLEILRLPVSPLRHAGYLIPDRTDRQWERTPETVGVGPDNRALAVWASREHPQRRLITVHDGGRQPVQSVQLDGCIQPWFVQPIPGDHILLARSRPLTARQERRHQIGDRVRLAGARWPLNHDPRLGPKQLDDVHLLIVRRQGKERVATEYVAVDSTLTPQPPITLLGLRIHHKLSKRNGNLCVRLAQRLSDVLVSLGKERPCADVPTAPAKS